MAVLDEEHPQIGGERPHTPPVDYLVEDGVAVVALNRPERLNAVNAALVEELCTSLDRAAAANVGALVLCGRGRAFSAGHDLKEDSNDKNPGMTRQRLWRLQDVTRKIQQLPVPAIAAVQGFALGAGCEFALSCDLVLAHPDAIFGFPEVEVGLSVTGGISYLLPHLVGPAKAKELVLFGTRVDATEALRLGLVNAVTKDAMAQARTWALELAGRPRVA
ncbi:MAG: enoyl-CoA hydratase/isomerase family protein, partial [Acidimicrobiales bacterium]